MIKADTKTKVAAAKLTATKRQIEPIIAAMQFPVDVELRRQLREREQAARVLKDVDEQIAYYMRHIDDYRQQQITATEVVENLKELGELPKPTAEDAQKQLDELLALPWVQEVKVDGQALKVIARKGFLKTKLEKRTVALGAGNCAVEFLPEPVLVEMPQYEFNFNPFNCGEGGWANNARKIGIRMIDNADASTFIGGKVMPRLIYAHWATGDGQGMKEWSGLCFGEYEDDLNAASIQGIAAFFSELATYLQTCGDEHAYRRKEQWALGLGKPAYNPYVLREAAADETQASIAAQYKQDFKRFNKIEFKEGAEVNPGGNGANTGVGAAMNTLMEMRLQEMHRMPTGIIAPFPAGYYRNTTQPEDVRQWITVNNPYLMTEEETEAAVDEELLEDNIFD